MSEETKLQKTPQQTPVQADEPAAQTPQPAAPDAAEEEALIAEQYRQMGLQAPGQEEKSMDALAQQLSTFAKTEEQVPKKPVGRKSSKKTVWLALGLLLLAAVGTLLYFSVIRPALQKEEQTELPELIAASNEDTENGKAETLSGQTLLLYRQMDSKEIASVAIENESGSYLIRRNDANTAYILDAYPNITLNQQTVAYLLSITSVPITQSRVSTDLSDTAQYGLDTPAAVYTVTTTGGVSHTVYVGDPSPSAAGYYVRYEDREAVYLMSSVLGQTVLAKMTDFVSAYVTVPVSESEYYLQDNFCLYHGDELLMRVRFLPENERQGLASTRIFEMEYPADYNLSMDNYDRAVLCTLGSLTGTEVLALDLSDETLAKYGLDHPAYTVTYTYEGTDIKLYFSEQQEDGSYLCASGPYQTVVRVDGTSLKFLSWDLIEFIDRPIFGRRITDVVSVAIDGTVDGAPVSADFALSHGKDSKGAATLSVLDRVSDTQIASIPDFRNLYKVLLTVSIEDYAPYTEGTLPQSAELLGTVTVQTNGGGVLRYQFFAYSGRRCLYTINGKGEFYVPRDRVEKLLRDTATLLAGGAVDSDIRK